MRAGGSEENKQGVFVQVTLFISAHRGGTKCTAVKEVSPHTYGSRASTTWLAQAQALLCRVTARGFQGSCRPQCRVFGALCIAGCAEMGRAVIKCWWEGHFVLAPTTPPVGTSSGEDPQPPRRWIDPRKRLIQNHNLLVQHLAAEGLMDQS